MSLACVYHVTSLCMPCHLQTVVLKPSVNYMTNEMIIVCNFIPVVFFLLFLEFINDLGAVSIRLRLVW